MTPSNFPLNRCPVSRERASKRVLILRLAAHGDILMGTPLVAALRRAWPDAHITWIVGRDARGAIEAHPEVDEILLWETDYWTKRLRKGGPLFQQAWALRATALRRALKANAYDVFISLQPEEFPSFTAAVAAPTTIGVFDTFQQFHGVSHTSRNTEQYTHPFTAADLPEHRAEQYLLPVRALDLPPPQDRRMRMGFTAEDARTAGEFLTSQGVPPECSLVILAPMTTWPSRCWPAVRYAALGDALAKSGSSIMIIGSAREQEQVAIADIAARMQIKPSVTTGALNFRQMAALIARASALVSGDTGPMHVASAVGTAFVSLFGPTPVAGRAPLAGRGMALMHPVPCGPCDQEVCPNTGEDFMRCMKLLTVSEVLGAVIALLEEQKTSL